MAGAKTHSGWVEFPSGTDMVRAYFAHPEGEGPWGAIITAPENLGLTEHRQEETRKLAAKGFYVLTIDPYSRIGGRPPQDYKTQEERRRLAFLAARDQVVVPDLEAAHDWVVEQPQVRADRVAALGYCLGGGPAFVWCTKTSRLQCGVILYALPIIPAYYSPTDAPLSRIELAGQVKCPLQLHVGDCDEAIPTEDSLAFKEALEKESPFPVDFQIHEGARHAYMDSTLERFHPEWAKYTFDEMVRFFSKHLN